jgi:hypothetical protein
LVSRCLPLLVSREEVGELPACTPYIVRVIRIMSYISSFLAPGIIRFENKSTCAHKFAKGTYLEGLLQRSHHHPSNQTLLFTD